VNFVGSVISGQSVFGDPQHEGHGGATDADIAADVLTWLRQADPVDVVLLHIGTNDLNTDPSDVEAILDQIDAYETGPGGRPVWVILARIINRMNHTCPSPSTTTTFNRNVAAMAQDRIDNDGDKIIIVDMECGANIDYRARPQGDMNDDLHPFSTGYDKMAAVWFDDGLKQILPTADAGPDQSVDEGDRVTLDGSGSTFPNGAEHYSWAQTGGPLVTLSSRTAVQPSFTAPGVGSAGETLTFTLTVTDGGALSHTATVRVTVGNNNSSSGGGGGGGCFIATSAQGSPAVEPYRAERALRSFGVLAGALALVAAALRVGMRWRNRDRMRGKGGRLS
jgi:lysophospholipase L1-like esterase